MVMVEDEAAGAVRRAYLEKGEWPAVAELRRFYRIDDNAAALRVVGTIASWRPPAERAPEPDRARKGRACRAGAAGVSNAPDHS